MCNRVIQPLQRQNASAQTEHPDFAVIVDTHRLTVREIIDENKDITRSTILTHHLRHTIRSSGRQRIDMAYRPTQRAGNRKIQNGKYGGEHAAAHRNYHVFSSAPQNSRQSIMCRQNCICIIDSAIEPPKALIVSIAGTPSRSRAMAGRSQCTRLLHLSYAVY